MSESGSSGAGIAFTGMNMPVRGSWTKKHGFKGENPFAVGLVVFAFGRVEFEVFNGIEGVLSGAREVFGEGFGDDFIKDASLSSIDIFSNCCERLLILENEVNEL